MVKWRDYIRNLGPAAPPTIQGINSLGFPLLSDLGDAATKDVGTGPGTVAAGDDSRIVGAAQKSANLSDLSEAKTALLNLGLDAYPVAKYGPIIIGDNSAVINAAIDAAYADGGGTVILPPGTTQATSIILKDKVRLVPHGRGSTLLNIGSATYFLRAEGSLGGAVSLTADAAAGATQITVASTSGIAANDYIVISDNYSYAATDATYKSGETAQVKSVDSGTQLTLVGALYGSMYPGGAYTTANSAIVRRVSPIIAPSIEDVEFLGDFASTTTAIHAIHVLNGKFSPRVKHYGNSGLLLRGVIDTEAVGGVYDDILDDGVNGHSGYGIVAAGPTSGLKVLGNTLSRCRHGFTTIGGSTGFPHRVELIANQCHDTSQAALDTHAAGDDILISGNDICRSAGMGISSRSRNTRIQNNDIYDVASHGIGLVEDGLDNVTVDGNKIDKANGHGISCSSSCKNLRITRNMLTNIGIDGITCFGSGTFDSTGLAIQGNTILGFGLALANRQGIITQGPVGSTGGVISGNFVAPLTGSANYCIRAQNLTASAVIDNSASGTFAIAVFDTGTNIALGNKRVDGSVAQIQLDPTGSTIRSIGPNPNEDILFIPKGTGRLRFGTWTASADAAINGYFEIRTIDGTVRRVPTF